MLGTILGLWLIPTSLVVGQANVRGQGPVEVTVEPEADSSVGYGAGWTYPYCQWQIKEEFNASQQGYLDPQAVYWAQIIRGARSDQLYKIKGKYPPVKYFSWQVYVGVGTADSAASVADYKLSAHWGCSPFNDEECSPSATGGYELFLTPTGTYGYRNELRLPNGAYNVLILRMYQTDPMLPASVTIKDIVPPVLYYGIHLFNGTLQWTPYPECNPSQQRAIATLGNTFYQLNYPQATGTLGRDVILQDFNCPLNPDRGNVSFVLFEGAWLGDPKDPSNNLVARQSADSPYMFYCINPHNKWQHYQKTIYRFRFQMPTFPDGLYKDVKVADRQAYDLRYYSIATGDGVLPEPTAVGISDREIRSFYASKRQSWDRHVEVVVALNQQQATQCGFYDPNNIFLPLTADPQAHAAKSSAIIIRSTLATGPHTAGAASRACNKGFECGNPHFIRGIMQEQYPELEVYHCELTSKGPVVTRYHDYWGTH